MTDLKTDCYKSKECLNYGKRCEACWAMSDLTDNYPCYKTKADIDRETALLILSEISSVAKPDYDLFGNPILRISRDKFEAIRKRYLD